LPPTHSPQSRKGGRHTADGGQSTFPNSPHVAGGGCDCFIVVPPGAGVVLRGEKDAVEMAFESVFVVSSIVNSRRSATTWHKRFDGESFRRGRSFSFELSFELSFPQPPFELLD
jgi:hypothetical protein